MLKCVAIDDEPLAIQLLSDYIKKTKGVSMLQSFSNPIEALHFIQSSEVDLIFLDVQMPELTGIQLMKILNQQHQIILTTAYQQYAIDGFEFDVTDYLLKPISYDRFFIAVQKAMARVTPADVASVTAGEQQEDYIFVKSEYRVQRIDLKDISFFEGLGDYVAIHTKKGKILTLEKMKHFEETLPIGSFMRVHKSYIIAISKIEFIERNRIVIGTERIPISETYKKAFWERIKN